MNTVSVKPWPYSNSQTFVPAWWNPSETNLNPPWIYIATNIDEKPTCESCEWLCRDERLGDAGIGQCRANPPSIDGALDKTWPHVFSHAWCGQHKPKRTGFKLYPYQHPGGEPMPLPPLPPLEIRRAVCEMAALDALVEAGIFERISIIKKSRWGRWRAAKIVP